MAQVTTDYASSVIIIYLILITSPATFALIHSFYSSSSSSSANKHVSLDVSGSMKKALRVFSSKKLGTGQIQPFIHRTTTSPKTNNSSFLSIPLHSRTCLHSSNYHSHNKNYTSLTLSRLDRDSARVHSIHSTHSLSLFAFSISDLKSKQLQFPVTFRTSQGSGEYFAQVGLGQPVKENFMLIDTGSDISWLQCQPCSDCYKQNGPIYNPSASSTYKKLTCDSQQCAALQVSSCRTNTCIYKVTYKDKSFTVGDFATEAMSFDGTTVPNIALGCGHHNEGLFDGAAGLLGLGGGPLGLASQINATSFSYCLVSRDSSSSSTLEFNSAHPTDSVLAPLLKNSLINTYYYVGLTGIIIGGQVVDIPASVFQIGMDGKGGVVIDSGTAVTRFPPKIYVLLRDAFIKSTKNLPSSGGFALFDTCYDLSSMRRVNIPSMSFLFSGGKTLRLRSSNYMIPVDNAGKFCFAFANTSISLSIIGSIQQEGMRVSYDLANKFVGFSPNKC